MKIIISADDFGCSPEVNEAIIRGFKMGIIEQATTIANDEFFVEACQLARSNGLGDRIGIHFNLTLGSQSIYKWYRIRYFAQITVNLNFDAIRNCCYQNLK